MESTNPKVKMIELVTQLKVAIEMIYEVSVWVAGPVYTALVKVQNELIAARLQILSAYDEACAHKQP